MMGVSSALMANAFPLGQQDCQQPKTLADNDDDQTANSDDDANVDDDGNVTKLAIQIFR